MSNSLCTFVILSLAWLQVFAPTENIQDPSFKKLSVIDSTEVERISINTDRSQILWKGTEMWKSGKHEGTVNLSAGYLEVKDDQITGGKIVADMNSIAITDIPEHDPIPRKRLRNHLKSEDFFYVKKYPKAVFEIVKTEEFKPDSLKVWGILSIRDVAGPISFIASKTSEPDSTLAFKATFRFDRFAWNISYQGSYWKRITSILDNTFVDADIHLTVHLFTDTQKISVQ